MMPYKKVVITGPESTGKSTLAEQLAKHYHSEFIPEYARTYVEKLNRPYVYEDLEHIAKRQIQDLKTYESNSNNIFFLDTYLIITKVWFDVVFHKHPDWIIESIKNSNIDLYLLCATDLPWQPDSVRENGGEKREQLFTMYQQELEKYGLNYRIVRGLGEERLDNATLFVDKILNK
jgi:NadR type nicotinamide-nucleotide adenylyltransferase